MGRPTIYSGLAAALMAVVLAGCTSFAPVYGTNAAGSIASARFNFLPPDSRIEQLIIDRLKVAFPGEASPQDPTLDIAASAGSYPGSMSDAFDVARPANVRVTASVTIEQDDAVLFAATRFSDTAYQSGKLTPVEISSRTGAQETAARNAAEALRAAILAGYRPGMPASVR
ncbi:hypothetical protein NIM87_12835 [Devosia sp. XJ19-1]|uniref:LPS-assembly lipoprotein n=1 Tax=Devosia ureilytica TaxID=2952754 RepID=A0A9Q4AQI8_9HYPH|nr:hypothetical protein [Devosia ureilytica]MCP8884397.1 hypothetical protein [Devosia ureilytica]MCP8888005.1 hypothetical protein [Devosia ureilytica]